MRPRLRSSGRNGRMMRFRSMRTTSLAARGSALGVSASNILLRTDASSPEEITLVNQPSSKSLGRTHWSQAAVALALVVAGCHRAPGGLHAPTDEIPAWAAIAG